MSTNIVGFRQADQQWNNMKAAWDACEKAGLEAPKAVLDFFQDEPPGDKPGMEIDISNAVSEWRDEYKEGFELDVSKLPQGVTIIRFYNSW